MQPMKLGKAELHASAFSPGNGGNNSPSITQHLALSKLFISSTYYYSHYHYSLTQLPKWKANIQPQLPGCP